MKNKMYKLLQVTLSFLLLTGGFFGILDTAEIDLSAKSTAFDIGAGTKESPTYRVEADSPEVDGGVNVKGDGNAISLIYDSKEQKATAFRVTPSYWNSQIDVPVIDSISLINSGSFVKKTDNGNFIVLSRYGQRISGVSGSKDASTVILLDPNGEILNVEYLQNDFSGALIGESVVKTDEGKDVEAFIIYHTLSNKNIAFSKETGERLENVPVFRNVLNSGNTTGGTGALDFYQSIGNIGMYTGGTISFKYWEAGMPTSIFTESRIYKDIGNGEYTAIATPRATWVNAREQNKDITRSTNWTRVLIQEENGSKANVLVMERMAVGDNVGIPGRPAEINGFFGYTNYTINEDETVTENNYIDYTEDFVDGFMPSFLGLINDGNDIVIKLSDMVNIGKFRYDILDKQTLQKKAVLDEELFKDLDVSSLAFDLNNNGYIALAAVSEDVPEPLNKYGVYDAGAISLVLNIEENQVALLNAASVAIPGISAVVDSYEQIVSGGRTLYAMNVLNETTDAYIDWKGAEFEGGGEMSPGLFTAIPGNDYAPKLPNLNDDSKRVQLSPTMTQSEVEELLLEPLKVKMVAQGANVLSEDNPTYIYDDYTSDYDLFRRINKNPLEPGFMNKPINWEDFGMTVVGIDPQTGQKQYRLGEHQNITFMVTDNAMNQTVTSMRAIEVIDENTTVGPQIPEGDINSPAIELKLEANSFAINASKVATTDLKVADIRGANGANIKAWYKNVLDVDTGEWVWATQNNTAVTIDEAERLAIKGPGTYPLTLTYTRGTKEITHKVWVLVKSDDFQTGPEGNEDQADHQFATFSGKPQYAKYEVSQFSNINDLTGASIVDAIPTKYTNIILETGNPSNQSLASLKLINSANQVIADNPTELAAFLSAPQIGHYTVQYVTREYTLGEGTDTAMTRGASTFVFPFEVTEDPLSSIEVLPANHFEVIEAGNQMTPAELDTLIKRGVTAKNAAGQNIINNIDIAVEQNTQNGATNVATKTTLASKDAIDTTQATKLPYKVIFSSTDEASQVTTTAVKWIYIHEKGNAPVRGTQYILQADKSFNKTPAQVNTSEAAVIQDANAYSLEMATPIDDAGTIHFGDITTPSLGGYSTTPGGYSITISSTDGVNTSGFDNTRIEKPVIANVSDNDPAWGLDFISNKTIYIHEVAATKANLVDALNIKAWNPATGTTVTPTITVTPELTETVGDYTVTIKNPVTSAESTATITVVKSDAPIIELKPAYQQANNEIRLELGEEPLPLKDYIVVKDSAVIGEAPTESAELLEKTTPVGAIQKDTAGVYIVTYSVTDQDNNSAELTVRFIVGGTGQRIGDYEFFGTSYGMKHSDANLAQTNLATIQTRGKVKILNVQTGLPATPKLNPESTFKINQETKLVDEGIYNVEFTTAAIENEDNPYFTLPITVYSDDAEEIELPDGTTYIVNGKNATYRPSQTLGQTAEVLVGVEILKISGNTITNLGIPADVTVTSGGFDAANPIAQEEPYKVDVSYTYRGTLQTKTFNLTIETGGLPQVNPDGAVIRVTQNSNVVPRSYIDPTDAEDASGNLDVVMVTSTGATLAENGTIDTSEVGTVETVTYTVTDSDNNVATAMITFVVADEDTVIIEGVNYNLILSANAFEIQDTQVAQSIVLRQDQVIDKTNAIVTPRKAGLEKAVPVVDLQGYTGTAKVYYPVISVDKELATNEKITAIVLNDNQTAVGNYVFEQTGSTQYRYSQAKGKQLSELLTFTITDTRTNTVLTPSEYTITAKDDQGIAYALQDPTFGMYAVEVAVKGAPAPLAIWTGATFEVTRGAIPEIILAPGTERVAVEVGATVDVNANVTVEDDYDSDLQAIPSATKVNTSTPREVTITYTVTDTDKNSALPVTRTYIVGADSVDKDYSIAGLSFKQIDVGLLPVTAETLKDLAEIEVYKKDTSLADKSRADVQVSITDIPDTARPGDRYVVEFTMADAGTKTTTFEIVKSPEIPTTETEFIQGENVSKRISQLAGFTLQQLVDAKVYSRTNPPVQNMNPTWTVAEIHQGSITGPVVQLSDIMKITEITNANRTYTIVLQTEHSIKHSFTLTLVDGETPTIILGDGQLIEKPLTTGNINILSDVTAQESDGTAINHAEITATINGVSGTTIDLNKQGVYNVEYQVTGNDNVTQTENRVYVIGKTIKDLGQDNNTYFYFTNKAFATRLDGYATTNARILDALKQDGMTTVEAYSVSDEFVSTKVTAEVKDASLYQKAYGQYPITLGVRNVDVAVTSANVAGLVTYLPVDISEDYHLDFEPTQTYRPSQLRDVDGEALKELVGITVYDINDPLLTTNVNDTHLEDVTYIPSWNTANPAVREAAYSDAVSMLNAATETLQVTIVSGKAPVITATAKDKIVLAGDAVNLSDYFTATDEEDNAANVPLTVTYTVDGTNASENLDTTTVGTYIITATATDSDGNSTIFTYYVVVNSPDGEIEVSNLYTLKASNFTRSLDELQDDQAGNTELAVLGHAKALVTSLPQPNGTFSPAKEPKVLPSDLAAYKAATEEGYYRLRITPDGVNTPRRDVIATIMDGNTSIDPTTGIMMGMKHEDVVARPSEVRGQTLQAITGSWAKTPDNKSVAISNLQVTGVERTTGAAYDVNKPVAGIYDITFAVLQGGTPIATTLTTTLTIDAGNAPVLSFIGNTANVALPQTMTNAPVDLLADVQKKDVEDEEDGTLNLNNIVATPNQISTTTVGTQPVVYNTIDTDDNPSNTLTRNYFIGAENIGNYAVVSSKYVSQSTAEVDPATAAMVQAASASITPINGAPVADFATPIRNGYGDTIEENIYRLGDFNVKFTVEGDASNSYSETLFAVHDGKNIPKETDTARLVAYDQQKYVSQLEDNGAALDIRAIMQVSGWLRDENQTVIPESEITAVIRNSKNQIVTVADIIALENRAASENFTVTFTYSKDTAIKTVQTLTITQGDLPQIHLGDTQTTFPLNTPVDRAFFSQAVSATDEEDDRDGKEVKIVIEGYEDIDTSQSGIHKVSYYAVDSDGNASSIKTRIYTFGDYFIRGNYIFDGKAYMEQELKDVSTNKTNMLRLAATNGNPMIRAYQKDTLEEATVVVLDEEGWNTYKETKVPGKFVIAFGVESETDPRASVYEIPLTVTNQPLEPTERYHIEAKSPQSFYIHEVKGDADITALLDVHAWDKTTTNNSEIVEPAIYYEGAWNVNNPVAGTYNVKYQFTDAAITTERTIQVEIKAGDKPVIHATKGLNIKVPVGETVTLADYARVTDTEEGTALTATATVAGSVETTLTRTTQTGVAVTYTVTDRDGNNAEPLTINFIFTDTGVVGTNYTLIAENAVVDVADVTENDDLIAMTNAEALSNNGGANGTVNVVNNGGYKAEAGVYTIDLEVEEEKSVKKSVYVTVVDETTGGIDNGLFIKTNGVTIKRPSEVRGQTLKEILAPTATIIEGNKALDSRFIQVSAPGYDVANPQAGTYTVTIASTNPQNPGSIEVEFTIDLGSKPVVTLAPGTQVIGMAVGSPLPDLKAGVQASDIDGDSEASLLATLATSGTVNPSVPGKYEVTYQVTDADRNKSDITATTTRTYFVGTTEILPTQQYVVTSLGNVFVRTDAVDTDVDQVLLTAGVQVFTNPANPGAPAIQLPQDSHLLTIDQAGYTDIVGDYPMTFSVTGDSAASHTTFGVYDDSNIPQPPTPGRTQRIRANSQTERVSAVKAATSIYELMDVYAWNSGSLTQVPDTDIKVTLNNKEITLAELQGLVEPNKSYVLTFKTAASDAVQVTLSVKDANGPLITVQPQTIRLAQGATVPNLLTGVTAVDSDDATNITNTLVVTNPTEINTAVPGIYTIIYEATGVDGIKGTAERLYIVGNTKPTEDGNYEFFAQDFEVNVNNANPATILRDARVDGKNEVEAYKLVQDENGITTAEKVVAEVRDIDGYTQTPGAYTITLGVKGEPTATVTIIASVVEGEPEPNEAVAISAPTPQTHRLGSVKGKTIEDLNNEVATLFNASAWNKATGEPIDVALTQVPWNVTNPQPGEYSVPLYAAGRAENKVITVILIAGENPVITVKPQAVLITDPIAPNLLDGVTANDPEDGDITTDIIATPNQVDITRNGNTLVTYTVTDTDGNTSTATRTYIVRTETDVTPKPVPPIIGESIFIDANDITIVDTEVAETEEERKAQVLELSNAIALNLETLEQDGEVIVTNLGGFRRMEGTYTAELKATNETNAKTPTTKVTITVTGTIKPEKPGVGDGFVEAGKDPEVSGTGTPGDEIIITLPDGTVLPPVIIDEDGNWSTTLPGDVEDGQVIEIVQKDDEGRESDIVKVPVKDTTPPNKPVVNPIDQGSNPIISGTGEPGSTITITLPDGKEVTTPVDEDGNWTIQIDTPLAEGDEVKVTSTDKAGNESDPTIVTVRPDKPTTPGVGDGFVEAGKDPEVSGTGTPGDEIIITLPDGTVLPPVIIDEDGNWSTTLPGDFEDGQVIEIVQKDDEGRESDVIKVPVKDTTPPNKPEVNPVEAGENPTISGTAEPGSTVTITLPSGKEVTTTADENGNWSVKVDEPLNEGDIITVTATDKAGNESDATAVIVGGNGGHEGRITVQIDADNFTTDIKTVEKQKAAGTFEAFIIESAKAHATATFEEGQVEEVAVKVTDASMEAISQVAEYKVTLFVDKESIDEVLPQTRSLAEPFTEVTSPIIESREITVTVANDSTGNGTDNGNGGNNGQLPSTGEQIMETILYSGAGLLIAAMLVFVVLKKRKQQAITDKK